MTVRGLRQELGDDLAGGGAGQIGGPFTEAPQMATRPTGQNSEMLIAARNGHSTGPFAPECQSFLGNGSANDPTVGQFAARRLPAPGMFCATMVGLPGIWSPMKRASRAGYKS